jgi:hypothetical protein
VSELEQFFRTVYKPYGWLSDAQWRRLTETSTRRLPDGRVTPHYDPAMVQQFTHHPDDYLIWDHYDALDIPVLCCAAPTPTWCCAKPPSRCAARSGARGPAAGGRGAGCGHAPALNVPEQLDLVS